MPTSSLLTDYFGSLTQDSSPVSSTDYVMTLDASVSALKKVLIDDILTAAGGIPASGWVGAGETWVYVSADDPTYVFKVAGVDLTTKYQAGMRVKYTQSTGGTKYGIITKVAFSTDTNITVYQGTDYDMANEAISSPYYSPVKCPFGFTVDPTKWEVVVTDTTSRSQATPVSGTWYNLGAASINVPIGAWDLGYLVAPQFSDASDTTWSCYTTLSTGSSTESDVDFTNTYRVSNLLSFIGSQYREKPVVVTAKTPYYINTKTDIANMDTLLNRNDLSKLIIRARCAYL